MLSLVLILLASIYFPGVIVKVKAIFSGRKGPSILQPWYDIFRLLKKGSVYSTSSSFIFQIGGPIYFSTVLLAALFVPFEEATAVFSFTGDFVLFAYLLGLGRFLLIISALDVSSGFEGMGANREAFYSMLIEPAFFLLLGALAMFTGYNSFHEIFANLHYDSYFSAIIAIIAGYVLANITLVETSRLPVDDPLTHLELTMVHEVMVLDHSGFDLGIIKIANNIKFVLFSTLSANCFIPQSLDLSVRIGIFLLMQAFFAGGIGWLESFRSRNKMAMNAQYILSVSAIAMILIFVVIIIKNRI
ncbi:MAG: NADH-quinone oxidoreductase subunit H [Cyclobacteriaceae bacterium]|nr:NADH-quinone oxidoreductase subunit H [Cyclobacteriaceae bacterium]MDH4298125.1 NADH-quinone oxidoreductase subunit H [Cyclobacteriaceae bacterium]MDH5248514.1 NADH-quinone oxidoreductase subunit H [Cyclobacteriaceae bacterium]